MSEEEIEQVPRRRSARIIALEERREREKKALEESKKNNAECKGKDKVIVGEEDSDFIDDEDEDEDDDEYAPTKRRGRKSRPLHQLISLTQPMQGEHYAENRSTSRTNGSPRIPEKNMLEVILDLLQRNDSEELFAEPVNPDEDYYRIVKEPMDFATMRAKLHENMYTNMEQFKRDVYLICSNALNVNPASTVHHKVAEAINKQATQVFQFLSAHPEYFDMEFSHNKRSRGRKSLRRSRNTGRPRQLPPKLGGGNSGANSMEAEVEKRQTYCSSSGSIFSGVLDGPKGNLQFHKPASYYQDSLLRFVEGMGPKAQTCAAKKIETLRFNQILCGEAARPNPLANFLDSIENTLETSTSAPPPPPPPLSPLTATTIPAGHDVPESMQYPFLSNRPLTIPGFTPPAPQETRNVSFDRSGDYKGKKVVGAKSEWEARAAAIMGAYFMNKGGGGGLNLIGEGQSSSNKASSSYYHSMSSLLNMSSSFPEANQNQGMQGMQWNNPPPATANVADNFVNAPSNIARNVTPSGHSPVWSYVWPSLVISGPQSKPHFEPISTSDRQVAEFYLRGPSRTPAVMRPLSDYTLSDLSLLSRQNQLRLEQEPITGHNLSGQSLHANQNKLDYDYTLLRQALLSQQKPAEQETGNNLSWQSFMPQQKPAETVTENNFSWQSFIPQQNLLEPMTGYNFLGQSLLSQDSRSDLMTGYTLTGQSFSAQQRSEDAGPITGWQSIVTQEKPSESMTCYNLSGQSYMLQQKPEDAQLGTGYNILQAAKWTQEETSNLSNFGNTNQPEDFQTIWSSTDYNNIPFTDYASLYTAPPSVSDYPGEMPMQPDPGPGPSQLNPLGLFPRQIPRPLPPSAGLEMPMGLDTMNYYGSNAMGDQPAGGEGNSAQLQWDDDHQPNLALQL